MTSSRETGIVEYTADQKRVVDYTLKITEDQIGGGDDPVGFLIASHAALRQRVKELEEALDLTMIGGNHLANVLIKNLGATFPERTPYDMAPDDALRIICATDNYDIWCCWSALMRARALSGAKP